MGKQADAQTERDPADAGAHGSQIPYCVCKDCGNVILLPEWAVGRGVTHAIEEGDQHVFIDGEGHNAWLITGCEIE